MTSYYHVAPDTYSEGDDLLSYIELWNETGEEPEYKWREMSKEFYIDSEDAQVVCLFDNIEAARQFRSDYLPTGKILAVNIPEWAHQEGIHMGTVDEGFACVYHRIPATLCGETIITIAE